MIERGAVVAVRAGLADVSITPTAECGPCGGCADGARGARVLEDVSNVIGARVGDFVEVETAPSARRRAQLLLYGVPVAAALAGYLAGFLLGAWANVAPDVSGAVVSVLSTAAAVVCGGRAGRALAQGHETPRVRAIIARCRRQDS
ncbi:MAG TPA: SoxR reducing system RseC family protein [Coriobacteriia bacterium]|nr:SoxR reducing system RseC family protein [Coriobacteriia bacterium]